MSGVDDPAALLATALRLVDDPDPSTRFVWVPAATHLARQALEESLRRLWARKAPSLLGKPMRSQLIALPFYLEADLAARVAWVWSALSDAGHERDASSQPTLADLRAWITTLETFATRVG